MFQVPPPSRTQNPPVIGLLLQQLREGGFLVSDDTGKLRRNQESGMAAGNLLQLDHIICSIVFLHTPPPFALKLSIKTLKLYPCLVVCVCNPGLGEWR